MLQAELPPQGRLVGSGIRTPAKPERFPRTGVGAAVENAVRVHRREWWLQGQEESQSQLSGRVPLAPCVLPPHKTPLFKSQENSFF